jgi:ATP-dependent helicase/nuclease subunit B
VYPFSRRKDGSYSGGRAASLVTNEQLERLLAHNSQLIVAAAEAIFAGQVQLNPIRLNDKTTALQYSPYLAIMQFDAMLAENAYRDLPPLSAKQVLDLLKDEKGGSLS